MTIDFDKRDLEATEKLIKIFENLLNDADWDSTLLLRTSKKKIVALKEEAEDLARRLRQKIEGDPDTVRDHGETPKGWLKVYVSLYQSQGGNMTLWQEMLKSLDRYAVTRPIYKQEEDVQASIRAKPEIEKHAYAVVMVKQDDILNFDNPSADRTGYELFSLKEHSIKQENIVKFIHANRKTYKLHKGFLVPA
ncbi:MAG: Dot/Icm secretion system protein IcmQ [Gammaproteobacteria bacterium]|nr:Dot/Icm secretion system protein IcmQ [Gammaproteobacteria bacterium]